MLPPFLLRPASGALALALAALIDPPDGTLPVNEVNVYESPAAFASRIAPLRLGDPAPPLVADRWLAGAGALRPGGPGDAGGGVTAFTGFGRGKVTLVEHLASWCLPCRKSLPAVAELSRRYAGRGLVVIGVAGAEKDSGRAMESLVAEKALPFPIAFRKAPDAYDRWVRAARGSGLPWAFLVDREGRVAWWGQPFYEGFEGAVEAVLEGRHTAAFQPGAAAEVTGGGSAAWRLREEADAALEKGDAKKALEKLEALTRIDPERWWWEVVEAANLRAEKLKDPAGARRAALVAIGGVSRRNPHALTALAELLLTLPPPHRDATGALAAARAADALTFGADEDVRRVKTLAERSAARPSPKG